MKKIFLFLILMSSFAFAQKVLAPYSSIDSVKLKINFIINASQFGVVADSTDQTAHLQAAFDYLKSYGANPPHYGVFRPALILPPGKIVMSQILLENIQNVVIEGSGKWGTIIYPKNADDTLFMLSKFDASPSYLWQGTAQGFTFKNIAFVNPDYEGGFRQGYNREGIAIMDNGNGMLKIDNCFIRGFHYGVTSPYGGDINKYYDNWIEFNDFGIYLGPGSQHFEILGNLISVNSESIVIENDWDGVINCNQFGDECYNAISIKKVDVTEFGLTGGVGYYESNIEINNNWFETGAWSSGYPHYCDIWTYSNPHISGYPRYISADHNVLISGDIGMAAKNPDTVYSFWRNDAGIRNSNTNFLVYGNRIDCMVDTRFSDYIPFYQENCNVTDGWGYIPKYDTLEYNSIYQNKWRHISPDKFLIGDSTGGVTSLIDDSLGYNKNQHIFYTYKLGEPNGEPISLYNPTSPFEYFGRFGYSDVAKKFIIGNNIGKGEIYIGDNGRMDFMSTDSTYASHDTAYAFWNQGKSAVSAWISSGGNLYCQDLHVLGTSYISTTVDITDSLATNWHVSNQLWGAGTNILNGFSLTGNMNWGAYRINTALRTNLNPDSVFTRLDKLDTLNFVFGINSPSNGSYSLPFKFTKPATVVKVIGLRVGGTTFDANLAYSTDRSDGSPSTVFNSDQTVTNGTTGSDLTPDNPDIAQNDWMWMYTSGTPDVDQALFQVVVRWQ